MKNIISGPMLNNGYLRIFDAENNLLVELRFGKFTRKYKWWIASKIEKGTILRSGEADWWRAFGKNGNLLLEGAISLEDHGNGLALDTRQLIMHGEVIIGTFKVEAIDEKDLNRIKEILDAEALKRS